jgi:3-methyladenine DNA glycosylase AlkD
MGDSSRLEGMARYGIRTDHAVGVTVHELRRLARGLRTDH